MSADTCVFGYSFNLQRCSEAEIMHLMSLAKKTLNGCRRKATYSIDSITESAGYRPDDVYTLLECIKLSCENNFNGNRLLFKFILDEVKKLLVFTGRIYSDNEYILEEANRNVNSPAGILVDMTVKIWLQIANIFLTAEGKELYPTDPLILQCDRPLTSIGKQVSYIILDDLIHIAAVRFTRFASSSDLTIVNPFVNTSLESAFLSLSLTLAKHQIDTWSLVVDIVKQCTSKRENGPNAVSIRYYNLKNSAQVASARELLLFWLMSHFAHSTALESTLITSLVKIFVAREAPASDSSIKPSLIQLSKLLGKICTTSKCTVDVTFCLLELVMRTLNVNDEYQSLPVNGHQWLLTLKKVKPSNQQQSTSNESLFSCVLSLLAVVIDSLTRESSNGVNCQLAKLKGRLVSKIQVKKLQELNELGLYRFLSFFLLLALKRDQWKEMSDRVCEISQKILDVKSGNLWNAKVSTNVKALFTLLHSMPSELSTPPSKLKQLLCHSIPHLHASSSSSSSSAASSSSSRHPLATALCLSGKVNTNVVQVVFHVIRYNYLSKFQSEPCKTVLLFILQMHSTSKSNVQLHAKVQEEMRQLLDCLLERSIRLDSSEMSLMQDLVKCIVTDTRNHCPSLLREVIFGIVEAFASSFLESAPDSMLTKIFRALEVFIGACPELTSGTETVFGVLNRVIEGIEAKRMMGTEVLMRQFLNELLRKCSQ